jgi:hypothetical protein
LSFAIAEKSLVKDEAETEGAALAELELGLGLGAVPVLPELEPPHAASTDETKAAPATKLAALIDVFMHHQSLGCRQRVAGMPLTSG